MRSLTLSRDQIVSDEVYRVAPYGQRIREIGFEEFLLSTYPLNPAQFSSFGFVPEDRQASFHRPRTYDRALRDTANQLVAPGRQHSASLRNVRPPHSTRAASHALPAGGRIAEVNRQKAGAEPAHDRRLSEGHLPQVPSQQSSRAGGQVRSRKIALGLHRVHDFAPRDGGKHG